MARKKLSDNERMVTAPAKLPPALLRQVEALATDRQWKLSHAIRFLVSEGLKTINPKPQTDDSNVALSS